MAGLFGFFNPSRPGKGVDKDEPEKKGFFLFWEILGRKFVKLLQLNVLYILCCIPIITIGPATAAMCKILKNYINGKAVFLISDFFDAFKSDFKQSFIMGILNIIFTFLGCTAIYFYYLSAQENGAWYILMVLTMILMLLYIFMSMYVYILIATVADMSLMAKIRNSILLGILGIKRNTLVVFLLAVWWIAVWWSIPVGAMLTIVCACSFAQYLIVFSSYPIVEKYVFAPYYEKTGEQRPDEYYFDELEDDLLIFEDMGTKEEKVAQPTENKGKTIK